MLADRVADVTTDGRRPGASNWSAHWPLSLIFLGIPLWWVLGLMTAVPILLTAVMARDLLRRRERVVLPAGFTLWAMFLAWVAIGVLVLWTDAPGAVPGGGPARLLVFGLRAAWYAVATITMLWVISRTERELPTRWVFELVAVLFVVTTAGGVLGLVAPTLEFRSLVELVVPSGLRSNALVSSMIHPAAAEIQSVLGTPQPRPQAPFAFSNTWGSVMALSLPFFLVAWVKDGRPWQRAVSAVVLLVAAFPVVYSLNRGLWACLAMGAAGLVLLQLSKGRVAPLIATVVAFGALGLALSATSLGDVYHERLANQHSNERRSELLAQTVSSATRGSPVVGFGSTRDVQGNFISIAGGASSDCSACGVPALGTQGHLWLVIFSQGLVGTLLFVLFFGRCLASCWRCRTTSETVCTFVLAFFGLQVFVYDTLNLPFVVVMIAVALVAREHVTHERPDASRRRATVAWARLRQVGPFLALLALGGALLGGAWSLTRQPTYTASVSLLLAEVPVDLETATIDPDTERATRPEDISVDTEAGLVVSRQTIGRVATSAADVADLKARIRVTAPPRSRVLKISVRSTSPGDAVDAALLVSRAHLAARRDYFVTRRREALDETERQVAVLVRGASYAGGIADDSAAAQYTQDLLGRLQTEITALTVTPVEAGEIIGTSPAHEVPADREIPVASGLALGLAVGVLVAVCRPGWTLRPRRPWAPDVRRRRRPTLAR